MVNGYCSWTGRSQWDPGEPRSEWKRKIIRDIKLNLLLPKILYGDWKGNNLKLRKKDE